MKQHHAVQDITESLKTDDKVKAIFLKGSMGRGEEDDHSDVDLYCLVEEKDKAAFLKERKKHLQVYREIIFFDDIFIIAPQIIAVYDNLLHLDLFTVTEETLLEKDFMKVLYDPQGRLEPFKPKQNLELTKTDFLNSIDDIAFFLLQYKKAAGRGNDIWAVKVLNDIVIHLAKVVLHKYHPERAQLGLKTIDRSLPQSLIDKFKDIMDGNTVTHHDKAVVGIISILETHLCWVKGEIDQTDYTLSFLNRMLQEFK